MRPIAACSNARSSAWRARSVVEKAERSLPAEWHGARERLENLIDFYASAENNTRSLLDALAKQQR